MLLKYSDKYEDIKFGLEKTVSNLKTEKIEEGIEIELDAEILDSFYSVLRYILKDSKFTVKDFERIRTTLEKVGIDGSFISYVSLYNNMTDLLMKTNLKNIKYIEEMVDKYNCQYMFFNLLKIQVGQIVNIEEVDNSENLFIEHVDFGSTVQIVSGLRKYYTKENLINKKALFITNIKKSKIMGIESNGMILCGKDNGNVEVLFVDDDIKIGSIARLENFEIFKNIPVNTIDLKKSFYKNLFNKLNIVNGIVHFDNYLINVGNKKITANINNGIIS